MVKSVLSFKIDQMASALSLLVDMVLNKRESAVFDSWLNLKNEKEEKKTSEDLCFKVKLKTEFYFFIAFFKN